MLSFCLQFVCIEVLSTGLENPKLRSATVWLIHHLSCVGSAITENVTAFNTQPGELSWCNVHDYNAVIIITSQNSSGVFKSHTANCNFSEM